MNERFELVFKPHRHKITYRMQVDVLSQSDQVIRFKLSAGKKFITMEKLLLKKTGSWKILETNIDLKDLPSQQASYTLFELQNKLDEYIKKDGAHSHKNP
jgi:hypothetical protein